MGQQLAVVNRALRDAHFVRPAFRIMTADSLKAVNYERRISGDSGVCISIGHPVGDDIALEFKFVSAGWKTKPLPESAPAHVRDVGFRCSYLVLKSVAFSPVSDQVNGHGGLPVAPG